MRTKFVCYADQDPVLFNIMLTQFFRYEVVCWSGSSASGIKSQADQDPVLYNSILARFVLYKITCWSGPSDIKQHDGPVLLV